jgi:hypothetical protein
LEVVDQHQAKAVVELKFLLGSLSKLGFQTKDLVQYSIWRWSGNNHSDDGEVFNFEVERQQLHRCQNMEKHPKYKGTEFCAVCSFLYSQIQLP